MKRDPNSIETRKYSRLDMLADIKWAELVARQKGSDEHSEIIRNL